MVVAEVGSNWKNKNDLLQSISAAAVAGADAVKFQLWDELYSQERAPEQWAVSQKYRLPLKWVVELHHSCRQVGIQFHLTLFNPRLYDLIEIAPDAVKVASGDLTYFPLLRKAAKFADTNGIPLVLSTGTHTHREVYKAVVTVLNITDNIVLLNCVSLYPAQLDCYDLQWIFQYRGNAGLGLSDHTMDSSLAVRAAETGSYGWFEKHFRLDHLTDTPDAPHSLPPGKFAKYCDDIATAFRRFEKEKEVHPAEEPERRWMQRGEDGLRPQC